MSRQVFINLPVIDLKKSMHYFTELGFSFNMQFSNDEAACMIINEQSYAMLLTHPFFKGFIKNEIADANKTTEVLIALSYESKEEVDRITEKAIALGAKEAREKQDLGFMYSRAIHDLDGHIWEIFHMDMNTLPQS